MRQRKSKTCDKENVFAEVAEGQLSEVAATPGDGCVIGMFI